jgi:hypothetical protein
MGLVKDTRAATARDDAARAANEGHTVFVMQLRAGMGFSASLTRNVPGFAEVMEAIEKLRWEINGQKVRWELDKSTFVIHDNNPTAYLIYRRAVVAPVLTGTVNGVPHQALTQPEMVH